MTSQYSDKTYTSQKLSTTATAMHINSTSPYQPQQQPPPPPAAQRHLPQQQVHNVLQTTTAPVPTQSASPHMQGALNHSNQQQNSWAVQQSGYLPPTKIMQSIPPATTVNAGTVNSWPQQQQPQQIQQNYSNVNTYQPNMGTQQPATQQLQQQSPQSQQQTADSTTYDNYYQQQPANNNMYQQQQPQQVGQPNVATFFQHQPQTTQSQTNAANFFGNSSNSNQITTGDGWGDWDWNDNSALSAAPVSGPPAAVVPEQSQTKADQPAVNQQQVNYNNSILADSFSSQNNNDSWSWGVNDNEQSVSDHKTLQKVDNAVKQIQNDNWNWNANANDSEKLQQMIAQNAANEQHNDSWNWQTTNENQERIANVHNALNAASSVTPPPPPSEFSSPTTMENHNYNTNGAATNIPNTVFVSQAKPVTLPSRQFASPPGGNTPVTEHPPETSLMPPQAFQNVKEALPPPNVATPPLANPPPPAGLPPAAGTLGNPFKRSGAAQHHRATGLMVTTANSNSIQPPATAPADFNVPPPPPADFANPGSVSIMEPDNNELPSQENQEVLNPPTTNNITLPNATLQPTAFTTLPNTTAFHANPPPNDERNQYLQTSHLSENAEEQQPEADGLLPPPGLSRLVLGEPELEASQQRMVMGTETPNAAAQAAVMRLEERHADGEDTASENALPILGAQGQAPPISSTLSSDRNLYLVPGESNSVTTNQQQRVVTGVELAEQREIEMDGENLEDEQIQHNQHLHQQNQLRVLSPEARNEPPVEGADNNASAPPSLTALNTSHAADHQPDQHHHSSNQLPKIKDLNPISSPNDDDDSDERLLNDRGMNQSTAGSSKTRAKYENERLAAAARRRDKRSSAERYESDEYYNSEGEYSSEREERERRERDRRRNYREGSVRSDRDLNDEEEKRSRRHRGANKRDKYYYEGEERSRGGGRDERERERGSERLKAERRSQRQRAGGYDADLRYETEESTRFDSRKDPSRRSTRRKEQGDQGADYDDYSRRGAYRSSKKQTDNYESDRRDRRRSDKHREPRFREDPRYDPREYEDYRKHSSRNARDSDLEKEGGANSRSGRMHHDPRHAAAAAMYGYPSSGYYDPYTAYYYQQMARTNPQAYAEWYKKYYGQTAVSVAQGVSLPGAGNATHTDNSLAATSGTNDGRESVHSGRSSAHNDIKDRSGALSVRDSEPIVPDRQRLTPCKFITEHAVVNFASGILVTVKPKYTPHGSVCNIVKLLKFKPNDETRKLFKIFPGPLVRGLTHKKTVIEFCHEQIRLGPLETTIYAKQLITNNAEKYRGSYTLMWNLLVLLLKQNGMVVGTDIAELLLKNQQQFPYQSPVSTANNSLDSKSGSASPAEELDLPRDVVEQVTDNIENPDKPEQELLTEVKESTHVVDDTEDNSLAKTVSNSTTLTEDEITEKFRNYLLYGNVNEALDWATDNNLWGHALFLASKLDRRSHANVMMKFANKLSLNDPLQTLYQLMSGRTPSSVTCVQDEKWGDWRPHLSMILSNTSQKPELDRKAITTLGDSLFNRGDLYAAHFCYLMAQVSFGRYQDTATQESSLQQHLPKLVLLGSSHYKHFRDFAHNESIIMTEIYEYACSLNDDKFSIVEFQPYKYILASRLLDYGFHLKSLMYLEQIAIHIARDPSKYDNSFINKVYEMADRLKYYDPVLEKTIDDQQTGSDDNNAVNLTAQQMEEQKWLQNLRQLAQQYKNNFSPSSFIPPTNLQDNQQMQDPNYYNQQQQQIDHQFMEINKQFSELNLQYQQPITTTTAGSVEQQQQTMFYNTEQQTQIGEQTALDAVYQQQQQSLQTELPNQNAKDFNQLPIDSTVGEAVTTTHDVYQQQPYLPQSELNTQPTGYSNNSNYYDHSQYNAAEQHQQQPAASLSYDYWAQQQQQTTDENARPTISMPKSKTYDTDDDANKFQQQQHAGNANSGKQQPALQQHQQEHKGNKKDDKDLNKNQQQSNQNSGWFGGIWNKFSLKPKNQMILPDDKNPSIVWDPEKKKWVNTDGDEDEQEALKPPPKMSDLMPQQYQQPTLMPSQQQPQLQQTNQIPFMDTQQMHTQQQPQLQQQYVPNAISQQAASPHNALQHQQQQHQQQNQTHNQAQAPGPAKTPTLQSNMFKMQRNRTLKNAYVDVFNPSGAPINKAAENILAPALPPAAVPQGGFFIPGSQPGAGNEQEQQYQQQQQEDTHQFYNPNQFASGSGY